MNNIIINGKEVVFSKLTITYQEICDLAGVLYKEGMYPTVIFQIKGYKDQSGESYSR